MEYYASELELNAKFHTFATNSSVLFRGHNTVQAQVKYKNKRGETTYKHTSRVLFMSQHQYLSAISIFNKMIKRHYIVQL